MGTYRRINVKSGRPLEKPAHYSRALRVGDTVLQAGTTAIDRRGQVRGVGDAARQVEAIMAIAEWSMGKAGGSLHDVVRSRIYVTDMAIADAAFSVVARYFRDARPATTLVQVSALGQPEQLVEIELDAVDGAARTARRISSGRPTEEQYAYSRAVRVGDRVFLSGSSALNDKGSVDSPADVYSQTRATLETLLSALEKAGGTRGDLVYTKSFLTSATGAADYTRAWVDTLGDTRPSSTLVIIPALLRPEMLVEIEAEAVVGAHRIRRDIYTRQRREHPRGYARAVLVDDWVWMSGCTALDDAGQLRAPGDWASQADLANETIRWTLEQAGATLDDVVRRRTFTVQQAKVNRAHGEGPAPYAKSCPASTGCRVSGLARPELLVEIEVAAVKGARDGIEWIEPDAVDVLDR
jgi:enamine deaminase RidA (YjgF/YER057c/UK114 family)